MFVWTMLAVGLVLGFPPDAPGQSAHAPSAGLWKKTLTTIRPSIVVLSAVDDERAPKKKDAQQRGMGVLIDGKGLLIAPHVALPAQAKLVATLADHSQVAADLVLTDVKLGIDVFQLRAQKLPAACQFLDSKQIELGEEVILLSIAWGDEHTATRGIISAKNREIGGEKVLQTDCSLGPGTFPGIVFAKSGEVVGVVSPQTERNGLGFALPGERLKAVVDDARRRMKAE